MMVKTPEPPVGRTGKKNELEEMMRKLSTAAAALAGLLALAAMALCQEPANRRAQEAQERAQEAQERAQEAPESALDAVAPGTITGEYTGIFWGRRDKGIVHASARIIAEGDGLYRAVLEAKTSPPLRFEMTGAMKFGEAVFEGEVESRLPTGRTRGEIFRISKPGIAKSSDLGDFLLLRSERRSPTESLAPPRGAVVLLPFEEGKETSLAAWENKEWLCLPDGSVQVNGGSNRTAADHGSGVFHIEFMCPFEPEKRGQGRGNSGVYFAGRYEIQILDSFGLEPGMGDCGSIYGIAITRENASLPPLRWQTYDVIYGAPREKEDGSFEPATMTVLHNGVRIHENQPVGRTTTAAPFNENAARGPLYLQDHGNPVRYRNIWYLELED